MVDTLYTASRLGVVRIAFAVERPRPFTRAILVATPRFESGADEPIEPTFKVFIDDNGYRAGDDSRERPTLAKLDSDGIGPSAWDQAKLAEAARVAVAANPAITRAVVSAENHISTEVLLATYAALLGPGCNQVERTSCLLVDLTIDPGAD